MYKTAIRGAVLHLAKTNSITIIKDKKIYRLSITNKHLNALLYRDNEDNEFNKKTMV